MFNRFLTEEKGLALPLAVVIIAVLTILGFTAAYLVESQTTMGLNYSGGEKALSAAEAGLNEYIWHINVDPTFPDSDRASSSSFAGYGTFGPQHAVGDTGDAFYQLNVQLPTATNPNLIVVSRGWPASNPSNTRTFTATLTKSQFCNYIYLSGSEVIPPNTIVYWTTGDTVNGPLHTNGQLHIDGFPNFLGPVTYSGADPDVQSGHATYPQGYPQKIPALTFPASNNDMATFAKLTGTYFRGRTFIYINGSKVIIRYTTWDNNNNITGENWLSGVDGKGIDIPKEGMVIYVDGTVSGSDSASWKNKFDRAAGNAFVSGQLDGRLTIASANNIYITGKDPTNFNYSKATNTGGLTYKNVKLDTSDDMLGLVANNDVKILHWGWPSNTSPYYNNQKTDVAPNNINIYAAILALNGCFTYEDYSSGYKGYIYLRGALAQSYRGAVGLVSGQGYSKDYSYDSRMLYDSPPHFLQPENAGWTILSWRYQ
ncbi:MAG: PilX N-terminal domain-containing pilus assembly protein [Bacillota bacterium]